MPCQALDPEESSDAQQEEGSVEGRCQEANGGAAQHLAQPHANPSDQRSPQTLQSTSAQPPAEAKGSHRAAPVAGCLSQDNSSLEGGSPCSSQLACADVDSSGAMFTPVPLVDRMRKAVVAYPLRLPRLPSPAPLPASCPATPAGQRRQPAPEEATPPLFGRPVSAGVGSTR